MPGRNPASGRANLKRTEAEGLIKTAPHPGAEDSPAPRSVHPSTRDTAWDAISNSDLNATKTNQPSRYPTPTHLDAQLTSNDARTTEHHTAYRCRTRRPDQHQVRGDTAAACTPTSRPSTCPIQRTKATRTEHSNGTSNTGRTWGETPPPTPQRRPVRSGETCERETEDIGALACFEGIRTSDRVV